MLEVKNLCVSFDDNKILDSFNLKVETREIVGLLGPSGSGKSTFLRTVAGLIIPDSGTVSINNTDVTLLPSHRRNIGMVFQNNQLFPHMDVGRNIQYGLKVKGINKHERQTKTAELLELVGLSGFEKRNIRELSGGEAKRIALARSLAPEPSILLLDEPLTGLDRELHDQLAIDLSKLLRETKTTAILVTHDKSEANTIADRVENI